MKGRPSAGPRPPAGARPAAARPAASGSGWSTAKRRADPAAATFVAFVLDQLSGLGEVRSRAMFGGHGLYLGEAFFGIAFRGRLYFRVDDESRPSYEARGSGPFTPDDKTVMRGYYEVPVEVLEDPHELERWASRAARR